MTTKKFDFEQIMLKDAQDWHQQYFNNEFYEDYFLPYYWENPWVTYNPYEGEAGTDEVYYAQLEYPEPKTGYPTTINFRTFADDLKGKIITSEDDYYEERVLKHEIDYIDCYFWVQNPCWLTKNFSDVEYSDPDLIMEKLQGLIKIQKKDWPKEVFANCKERLEESREINAKYHGEDKVKKEDFYFFDMVKSFYTNGKTMYKEYEKQRL